MSIILLSKLQITGCRLQIGKIKDLEDLKDCRLQIADWEDKRFRKFRKLQIAGYRLQIADWKIGDLEGLENYKLLKRV